MSIPYDLFTGEFLAKVTEFDFISLPEENRTAIIDGYMRRAISEFRKNCLYDFVSTGDDSVREFNVEVAAADIDEIVDIVSEGMVVQWLKTYVNRQEVLENAINTRDYTLYSPAELLRRVSGVYQSAKKDYTQMIREYSYNHGRLGDLHL